MLKINMFSTADKVAGQGVGSAYLELINLLKKHFSDQFEIKINHYDKSDISHYHTINPRFYFSTFSKKRGRKIGYVHFLPETLEGSLKIPQPFRSLFYKYVISFYKRMDHIVVVNPMFIDKLVNYGIDRDKISYIPNFVSKKEFYSVELDQKKQLKEKYNYDKNKFLVLCTGQVQTRKGVLDFAQLAKENPTIQFVWAGGFSFGKITAGYSELNQLFNNPPANLRFPGIVPREQLVEYYNMADVFLLPSYNELFPMSVLEAFSCGTPVILRNLDLYKVIIDGYYLPAENVSEMNQGLHHLFNNNESILNYRQKSLEASEYYSENHLAEFWQKFYTNQANEDK